jgi:GntR family transcriptional regulator
MTPADTKASGVELRRESGLPVYLQLVDQLRYLIGAGRFRAGEYLPATRLLASELQVNFNTVNRAYRQLQRDGLIRSTPGKGALVVRSTRSAEGSRSPLGAVVSAPSNDEIDAILLAALERALAAGVSVDDIGARVSSLLEALARRVPPKAKLVLDAGHDWRTSLLAERLEASTGRSVVPESSDGAADSGRDEGEVRRVAVIPRFGLWSPPTRRNYDAIVELPVHLARESVQRLLLVEPGARICVVAADADLHVWLVESVSALVAGPDSVRSLTTDHVVPQTAGEGEVLVVEQGLPGARAVVECRGDRTIEVAFAFATSAGVAIEDALDSVDRAVRFGA